MKFCNGLDQTLLKMPMAGSKRSYDDYLHFFNQMKLEWCKDQLIVLPVNKKNKTANKDFCDALYHSIRSRKEEPPKPKKKCVITNDEEEHGNVRLVPCGGKGQMVREVVPHNFE